jgi:MoaA/NifB/PqqE/SkfB family radical SAM enzyme
VNRRDSAARLLPRLAGCRLAHAGLPLGPRLIALTHSVTCACQSQCRTCGIGRRFRDHPELRLDDLTLEEIGKIYRSIGPVYFYNVSGGEPFLREDLPEIVGLAMRYLKPAIVHIPTNGFLPERIHETTGRILGIMRRSGREAVLTIKPSIDGLGEVHDRIRGLPGGFDRLLETIRRLKEIERDADGFHLELGTVVSIHNVGSLGEIEDFVHRLGVQSYRNEIAENREEFFNAGEDIAPGPEQYRELMRAFGRKIVGHIGGKKDLTKATEALRLVYYGLVPRILETKRQVIPCYAGISNAHLNYDGELWPCCVSGYSRPIGRLREFGYDVRAAYASPRAVETLRYIRKKSCHCPLANQTYSNILLHFPSLAKFLWAYVKLSAARNGS